MLDLLDLLDLLSLRAGAWIAPMGTGYETNPAVQSRIDAAATAAGRRPTEIRRVIQLVGSVTDHALTTERPHVGPGNQPIRTTPEYWARIIADFVHQERFDTVNFILERDSVEQITGSPPKSSLRHGLPPRRSRETMPRVSSPGPDHTLRRQRP
jgi:hypothetical protein